jgi:putative transposase
MARARYRRGSSCVYNPHLHLVRCPGYRGRCLWTRLPSARKPCRAMGAAALDAGVEGLEIMPGHVHPLVPVPPIDTPRHHANRLKGYTSRVSRQGFAHPRTGFPSPRLRSYRVGVAGHVLVGAIQHYIALRRGREQMRRAHKYQLYPNARAGTSVGGNAGNTPWALQQRPRPA